MSWWIWLPLFCFCRPAFSQDARPETREVDHFEATDLSRLAALAKLGAVTKTSLLIEAGEIEFLKRTVTISVDRETVGQVIVSILDGQEHYTIERHGGLIVVFPLDSLKSLNPILKLPLGSFSFEGKTISSLDGLISFSIRQATGCNPQGYGYAGPPMNLEIPPISLPSATFEEIVEQVARAPEPTMWIVNPDSGQSGCLEDAGNQWQVGLYGREGGQTLFRESIGPQLVK